VAKLADALDLGSSALRHGGSSPFIRTMSIPVYLIGHLVPLMFINLKKMYLGRITIIVLCLDGQVSDIKSFIEKRQLREVQYEKNNAIINDCFRSGIILCYCFGS
jgi:hypothetical protein